jgi:molybdopterin molybdotransferase
MITINEAKQIINENLPSSKKVTFPLHKALEKVLAQDIHAPEPSPRFDNSAMDGFAVLWEDVNFVTKNSPVVLRIAGESQAGTPYRGNFKPGEAIRISTGAALPKGTDTVLPIEETKSDNNFIKILQVKKRFQNIRFRGEEFKEGELLLKKGDSLNPSQIGLLASLGFTKIQIYQPPKISILVTGNELIPFNKKLSPGKIRDSNKIMLSTAIIKAGGEVTFAEQVEDIFDSTVNMVRKVEEISDIIICSGGVSVGQHDHVREAAIKAGYQSLIWKVRQQPGKPLFFAKKGETLLFGLPGNPVSAYICFHYYILPVIQHLQGKNEIPNTVWGTLSQSIENNTDRAQFYRVKLKWQEDKFPIVYPLEKQKSHMLTSISNADGFILIDVDLKITKGTTAEVILF